MSNLPMDPAFASLDKQPGEVLPDANAVRETVSAARLGTRPLLSHLDLEIEDHYVPSSNIRSLDPLRDEGLNYAHRLTEAGVAVELHPVRSIPHGFASIPSAAISARVSKEQIDVLRSLFRSKQSRLWPDSSRLFVRNDKAT
jgi:acetyl esterase/lipase